MTLKEELIRAAAKTLVVTTVAFTAKIALTKIQEAVEKDKNKDK